MRIRVLLFCGLLGGLVYTTGDFLFCGAFGDGASFHSLPIMAARSDTALILGGAVAPLGTILYVLGVLGLSLALPHPRLSRLFFASWTAVFAAGASYHAVFTVLGFAAKVPQEQARADLIQRIRSLLSAIYSIEFVFGIGGTILLAFLLWKSPKRWLILFMPTVWALLDFLPRFVSAPIGAVIAGGWINGWFVIFFAAALVAFQPAK
jgi:hypothetical protein